jgi:hypothetical protein
MPVMRSAGADPRVDSATTAPGTNCESRHDRSAASPPNNAAARGGDWWTAVVRLEKFAAKDRPLSQSTNGVSNYRGRGAIRSVSGLLAVA